MRKSSLKIKLRFALVLVVIIPALLAVAAAGVHGMRSERNSATELYANNIHNSEDATDLGLRLGDAHAASLELLLDHGDPAQTSIVTSELLTGISTDVEVGIAKVRADSADDPQQSADVKIIQHEWAHLQQFQAAGKLSGSSPASLAAEVNDVESTFDPMTAAAKSIVHIEADQAHRSYLEVLSSYNASVHLMLLVLIIGLILAAGMVVWLIRSVLTRTLSYSAFANAVSDGDFSTHLSPRGDDELDQLGTALEQLASRRQSEERYEKAKLEFTDTLQLTESEQEAHNLLKRYLERSISNCTVTILNRNNSADRLEAVTALSEGSPLSRSLNGAKPRSCLAVRMARPHVGQGEADTLLACSVCSDCPGHTICTPFLVGGEVIGSVLANHDAALVENEERSVREAVIQSAPILGNLRNLAIAEMRSATDALTGLPNRRAIEDTLKRMVAQSGRTVAPLAALMCDLDHFKNINDQFGHGNGDAVLAAVGTAFAHTLRVSDFVGRYGGEEFLILLPATGPDGAVEIAERVRQAVAEIRIPTVGQQVTLSVGIAVLPDHAVDAVSLERAADRALYAAKNAGRDRIEIFGADFSDVKSRGDLTVVNARRRTGASE